MGRRISRIYLFGFFSILSHMILGLGAVAQEPKIDDVAKKLAKQISHSKIKSVALQEFTAPDGSPSPQGKLLTALLFNYWGTHHESFSVLQPDKLEEFLSEHKFSAKDLDTRENLQQMGSTINVEALVSGTVAPGPNEFVLNVAVHRLQDGELLATGSQTFPRSGIFAGSDAPAPSDSTSKVLRAGLNGVGVPACVYCPPPDYTSKARADKVHGTVLLDIEVTLDGRATNIVVLHGPGEGLEEKAIEAVRSWRFRPAKDSTGNPVAVRVQIEVTFHLN